MHCHSMKPKTKCASLITRKKRLMCQCNIPTAQEQVDLPHVRSVHPGCLHTQGSAGYTGFTTGTPCSALLQPPHHAELEAELNYIHLMEERCNFMWYCRRNVPLHIAILPCPARGRLQREEGKVCSLVQALTTPSSS